MCASHRDLSHIEQKSQMEDIVEVESPPVVGADETEASAMRPTRLPWSGGMNSAAGGAGAPTFYAAPPPLVRPSLVCPGHSGVPAHLSPPTIYTPSTSISRPSLIRARAIAVPVTDVPPATMVSLPPPAPFHTSCSSSVRNQGAQSTSPGTPISESYVAPPITARPSLVRHLIRRPSPEASTADHGALSGTPAPITRAPPSKQGRQEGA